MTWRALVPEPLWVGFASRTAQCACGQQFKPRTILGDDVSVRHQYEVHWRAYHEAPALPSPQETP